MFLEVETTPEDDIWHEQDFDIGTVDLGEQEFKRKEPTVSWKTVEAAAFMVVCQKIKLYLLPRSQPAILSGEIQFISFSISKAWFALSNTSWLTRLLSSVR